MIPCPTCERFVRGSSRECPFCGTALRDGLAPAGGFAGLLLGLALAACTTEPGSEEGTTSTVGSSTTTEDPSATSTSSGQITSLDDSVGEVAAYAGPDTFSDTFSDTLGDTDTDTSTGTGTGTGSGTDTGTSSGTESGTDTGSSSGSGSSGGG